VLQPVRGHDTHNPSLQVMYSKVVLLKACTQLRGKAAEQWDIREAESQFDVGSDIQVCAKLGSNV